MGALALLSLAVVSVFSFVRHVGEVTDNHALRVEITKHRAQVDSLKAVTIILKDSLNTAHHATTKEKIKYVEIIPITYSLPALDSFFSARYGDVHHAEAVRR